MVSQLVGMAVNVSLIILRPDNSTVFGLVTVWLRNICASESNYVVLEKYLLKAAMNLVFLSDLSGIETGREH